MFLVPRSIGQRQASYFSQFSGHRGSECDNWRASTLVIYFAPIELTAFLLAFRPRSLWGKALMLRCPVWLKCRTGTTATTPSSAIATSSQIADGLSGCTAQLR